MQRVDKKNEVKDVGVALFQLEETSLSSSCW